MPSTATDAPSSPAGIPVRTHSALRDEDVAAFVDATDREMSGWLVAVSGMLGIVGACVVVGTTGWPYGTLPLAFLTCLTPIAATLFLAGSELERRKARLGLKPVDMQLLLDAYWKSLPHVPKKASRSERHRLLAERMVSVIRALPVGAGDKQTPGEL